MTARFVDQTGFVHLTTGTTVAVTHPSAIIGDVLVAVYGYHDTSFGPSTPPPRPLPPSGWVDGPTSSSSVEPLSASAYSNFEGRTGLFFTVVTAATPAQTVFTCPTAISADPSSIFAVTIFSLRGVGLASAGTFILETFTRGAAQSAPIGTFDAVSVLGTDRLAVVVAVGNFGALTDSGVPAYTKEREVHTVANRGASSIVYTAVTDVNIPAGVGSFTFPVNPTIGYTLFSFTLAPLVAPALRPAIADPIRLSLDCAEDYTVFITASDYRTRLGAVEYNRISWSRTLDDISVADVVVPDRYRGVRCTLPYGGLLPWRFGLLVERNGQEVWSGPIVTVERDPQSVDAVGTLRVGAMDVLSRHRKRLATLISTNYPSLDAGQIFADLIALARDPHDLWMLLCPNVLVNSPLTRELVARDFEMSYDVLQELMNSSIDAYVMNGDLYLFEPTTGWRYADRSTGETRTLIGPYNSAGELSYGLFTEGSWRERPGWNINGMAQGNRSWVPASDSGESGFRKFWTAQASEMFALDGVLDIVEVSTLYRPDASEASVFEDSFQHHADALVELRALAPAVISGGVLAEGAPIDIPNLRPGSLWNMDVWDAGLPQMLQTARLKSVEVTFTTSDSGAEERVVPTLQPAGFSPDV